MFTLLGILLTLLVAGVAIMTTVSHQQAVSNFASYFYDHGWPNIAKWIECHPGIILNGVVGLSIAAIICFVVPSLIWIRSRQQKIRLISILDDIFTRTGVLFGKSLDVNVFATSQAFNEEFDDLTKLMRARLKNHISAAELSVLVSGGQGGAAISYSGGSGKGYEYTQLQNQLISLRNNVSSLVGKYGRY